jgi:uncharacterized phosphosugar-binding protein
MTFKYFERIREILSLIEEKEKDNMFKASEMLAKKIMDKNSIFMFGASHAGILAEEVYFRAGGLVVFNPIFAKGLALDSLPISITSEMERLEGYGKILVEKSPIKAGDLVFIHSVSGRNPVGIEFAMEAQKRGAYVIAITNLEYSKSVTSRHSSKKRLYEVSNLVLDNHGDIGDAGVEIQGLDQKVAATSTVIGASIINTIISEAIRILVENGVKTPPVFYSANLDGGDEKNKLIEQEYKDQIFYKL